MVDGATGLELVKGPQDLEGYFFLTAHSGAFNKKTSSLIVKHGQSTAFKQAWRLNSLMRLAFCYSIIGTDEIKERTLGDGCQVDTFKELPESPKAFLQLASYPSSIDPTTSHAKTKFPTGSTSGLVRTSIKCFSESMPQIACTPSIRSISTDNSEIQASSMEAFDVPAMFSGPSIARS